VGGKNGDKIKELYFTVEYIGDKNFIPQV